MFRINRARAGSALALLAVVPLLMGGANLGSDFEERLLASHNLERAALGLPPLRWNDHLAIGAKEWADHLVSTQRFEHSPDVSGERVGENIWGGTRGRFSPERMIGRWIDEKRSFKRGVFPANSITGNSRDVSHYTQVIWRTTQDVGCALSRGPREDILVCRYQVPGNVYGQLPL
jgi:hypothetical protein